MVHVKRAEGETQLLATNNLSDVADSGDSYNNIKQIASDETVVTGTDTSKIVTPSGLSAKMSSPGAIGETVPGSGSFTEGKFDGRVAIKKIAEPAEVAGYGLLYFDDYGRLWAKNGDGPHTVVLSNHNLAEMYLFQNETSSIIDTDDAWHFLSLSEITVGEMEGWTFVAGTRGSDITKYETYNGGDSTLVTVTDDHALLQGDFFSITGTTNYNDIFEVLSAPGAKTFEIDKEWGGNDDAEGTYNRGGTLIAGETAGGIYRLIWGVTVTPQTNGHIFTASYVINKIVCTKGRARLRLGTASDFNDMSRANLVNIAASDRIQFVVKNIGASGDFTIRHGNLNLTTA